MKRLLKSLILIAITAAFICFTACSPSKTEGTASEAFSAVSEVSDSGSLSESSSLISSSPENTSDSDTEAVSSESEVSKITVEEDGEYSDKDHVALYIHEFGHLPSNYVTKKEAQAAGWVNSEGNLNTVLPGKSIGGDHYGNYEGLLPEGYSYTECDINFNPDNDMVDPVYRGGERIIFNEEGMIFYTDDHYKSFEQLY